MYCHKLFQLFINFLPIDNRICPYLMYIFSFNGPDGHFWAKTKLLPYVFNDLNICLDLMYNSQKSNTTYLHLHICNTK